MTLYTVYILKSEKDDKHYIGYTSNLERRLIEHNSGKEKATKARKPFKLVYKEEFADIKDAARKEMFLKSGKGRDYIKNILKV
jgi:putative endonuclease